MFEVNIGSSEPAASAALKLDEVPTNVRSEHRLEVSLRQVLRLSWMKSQLMFEVNIGSSEPAASAALKLDEVPTHVRSEHRLEVSLRQVLRPSWMKSQLMFEVNNCSSERAVPCTISWMKSQLVRSEHPSDCFSVGLGLRARVSYTASAVVGQVPSGDSSEPPTLLFPSK